MNGGTRFDAGDWPAPTELVGRYRLVALASTEPNGAVFRAHDTVLNESIAVKVVRRDRTGNVGTRAHLVREVRRARRLDHPNVIRTRDLVLVPTDLGADVLVTSEYVPGRTLARRIREHGPLPMPEVLRIGRSVADALVAAHTEGVLHGDVSPEHVLLADDGRVLLTDFGIGRALGDPASGSVERTDIHGLGTLLLAAWTGWLEEAPIPAAGPLAELVQGCLDERWTSIAQVREALRGIRDPDEPGTDGPLLPVPRGLGGARVTVFRLRATPELRHLADGASDEIAQALAMIDGLRVRTAGEGPATSDVEIHGEIRPDGPDVVLDVRLVTVPSGWRLWLGRFETDGVGLLRCAQRAAAAIARALTSSTVPHRHPGPTDPEALDLWLRGIGEGGLDRATALLELARGRAPEDPRVLAAVARVRLRRIRAILANRGGGRALRPIDVLLASAERLARTAAEGAPSLPEAQRALAEILAFRGDAIGAAHATRRALDASPGSPESRAAAGALWAEAGHLESSVLHLEQALSLDPERASTRADLARVYALLGRVDAIDTVLAPGPSVERSRFALWFPERSPGEPVCDRTRLLAAVHQGRPVSAAAWWVLETVEGEDARVRAASAQLAIEARIRAGFVDPTFRRLDLAARDGLLDQAWLDHCPVLDPLRRDPRFAVIRHRAAGRGRAIARALG